MSWVLFGQISGLMFLAYIFVSAIVRDGGRKK